MMTAMALNRHLSFQEGDELHDAAVKLGTFAKTLNKVECHTVQRCPHCSGEGDLFTDCSRCHGVGTLNVADVATEMCPDCAGEGDTLQECVHCKGTGEILVA
jgi:DnaJ-class molecular chaperone